MTRERARAIVEAFEALMLGHMEAGTTTRTLAKLREDAETALLLAFPEGEE